MHLSQHVRRGAILGALLLVATILVMWPRGAPLSADEPSLQEAVDRIQRVCLRAYPPELLAKMASGARQIPDQVEADPEAQMQFLDKEIPLDKGLFYPILLEDMLPAFERYISEKTRFLDLGSGDGRAVFLANVLGADAAGIEYDPQMVKISRRAAKALRDAVEPKRLKIVKGYFFDSPWSGYDVIYFFDLSSFEPDHVREKLRQEMDPGSLLIVGFEQAPFPGLELVERDRPQHPSITVYRQPAERSDGKP
jgi:SAM-dependent methyltransferase